MANPKNRNKKTAEPDIQQAPPTIEVAPVVAAPLTEAVAPPVEATGPKTVKVYAKRGHFQDLIKGTVITFEPVEVELHAWLQAQIDCGLLVLC